MTEGNRRRRIVYRNAHRQSNSSYMGDERRLNLLIVDLERKEIELDLEMRGLLDKFVHSDSKLAQDFREKNHNWMMLKQEILELKREREDCILKQQGKNMKESGD